MKNNWIIIIYSFFATSLSSFAQEEKMQCQLSVVHFGHDYASTEFYYKKGDSGSFVKLVSLSSSVPQPIKYVGPSLLSLYKKDNDAELGYTLVGKCKLKLNYKRVIVLADTRRKDNSIKLQAIESSINNLPFGSRMIANKTSASLRGIYSTLPMQKKKLKKTFTVQPGGFQLIKAIDPQSAALTPHYAHIEYLTKSKKTSSDWQTLCKSRWFNTPEQRHILFVYYQNDHLRVRGVTDGTLRPKNSSPHIVNSVEEQKKRDQSIAQNKESEQKKRKATEEKYKKSKLEKIRQAKAAQKKRAEEVKKNR